MKRERMNVLPDYNPWQINTKAPTTPNFRNGKIPRFDRNNPIMSWGQKHLFFKKESQAITLTIIFLSFFSFIC